MLATHVIDPEGPVHHLGGRVLGHGGRLRSGRPDGGPLVRLDGRLPDRAQGDLASLLKQPPDTAHIIRGADGMALHGGYERCVIPHETIGTWTTKIGRLHATGGWHALVYTKTAEYGYEKDSFLLLAQSAAEAPALHHRFLDKRSPLPLHDSWADWLWERGIEEGGDRSPPVRRRISAYRCSPKAQKLREDLSDAVASGRLTLPREGVRWIGR